MSDEHEHHDSHHVNYTAIFVVLCICTGLSWFFDEMKPYMTRPVLITLILAVASCKATFVLLYFMHIRFEAAWKYVLLAPTMVLACCVPFALAPDVAFHYYNVIVPQTFVVNEHGEAGEGGHADASHNDASHNDAARNDASHEKDSKGDAGHEAGTHGKGAEQGTKAVEKH